MPEPSALTHAEEGQNATVRVAGIAERQWGVVKRSQLHEAGVASNTIDRWLHTRRLHRLYPGIYAVGRRSLRIEGRLAAALFYAGEGAALSHTTAAWWWGLMEARPPIIDISAPRAARSLDDVRIHHPRYVERILHRGLPATPVPRTLRDVAAHLQFDDLRRVIAQAEYRRLVNLESVYRILGRGRPGAAKLRRALDAHLPELGRTLSPLEDQFLFLCDRYALPMPEPNAGLLGYRIDALWRQERVAVELDGGGAHATRAAMERDRTRDLELRGAGFVVLRYTWRQVTAEPAVVASDLRRALGII
jgi:Protein of unknown function (DUF559)